LSFGGASVTLCQLVTINGPNCGTYLPQTALSASLNVLQTLTTEAELANGTNAINVQSALGITGVGAATLTLQVVSPPQLAYGPAGTIANSGQVNGDLKLSGGSLPGTLDIPLTGAQGTATLNAVSCSQTNNSLISVAISASGTTASAAVTLGGASLGTLTITGAPSTPLAFGNLVLPPNGPNASTFQANTNPISSATTMPTFSGTATGFAATLLTSTLQPVLGPILQAAGVSVGGVTVADLSYNCGAVSLVK
jgi:uncharacterized membrane protein